MLIDIPEQVNCSHCPFKEEDYDVCLLGRALNPKEEWSVSHWFYTGYKLTKTEECRPEWCPLKQEGE